MYANYYLPNLDTVIRRSLYGFIQRLSASQNSNMRTIEQSWLVRIKLWDVWAKDLYLLVLIAVFNGVNDNILTNSFLWLITIYHFCVFFFLYNFSTSFMAW